MTKDLATRILVGEVLGTREQIQEAVKMAVKAINAEPVVRCEDCEWQDTWTCTMNYWRSSMMELADDFYCANGKHKGAE